MRIFRLAPSRIATLAAVLLVCSEVRDAGAQRRRSTNSSGNYSSRVDTTFAFDKSGAVSITSISGDIVITGWSRDQVHVRALSEDDNVRLDVSQSRMNLEVSTGRRGSD